MLLNVIGETFQDQFWIQIGQMIFRQISLLGTNSSKNMKSLLFFDIMYRWDAISSFFSKRLRSESVSLSSESDRPISTSAGSINQIKLHIFQWVRSLKFSDSGHQFQFRSPISSQNPIHFNQNRFFSQNLLKFLASKSFQVLNKC